MVQYHCKTCSFGLVYIFHSELNVFLCYLGKLIDMYSSGTGPSLWYRKYMFLETESRLQGSY